MTAPVPRSQPDNPELRQHTPTPWRVEVDQHFGPGFVITAEGMGNRCPVVRMSSPLGEADETLKGDAELIVEAVNSYASLKSQVERMTTWQPIATAPKDGTPILYINKFKEVGHCQHMLWPEEDNYEAWWDYQRDDEVCPLYWMAALPDLPSALSLDGSNDSA